MYFWYISNIKKKRIVCSDCGVFLQFRTCLFKLLSRCSAFFRFINTTHTYVLHYMYVYVCVYIVCSSWVHTHEYICMYIILFIDEFTHCAFYIIKHLCINL